MIAVGRCLSSNRGGDRFERQLQELFLLTSLKVYINVPGAVRRDEYQSRFGFIQEIWTRRQIIYGSGMHFKVRCLMNLRLSAL